MTTVLVFAEQRAGAFRKAAYEALAVGRSTADASSAKLAVLIIGSGIAGLAVEAGRHGADTVCVADHADLLNYSPEGYAAAFAKAYETVSPGAVILAATAMGKDLAPRVAARFNMALLSDVVELSFENDRARGIRPMYAAKVQATVTSAPGAVPIVTIRPNIFRASPPVEGRTAAVQNLEIGALNLKAKVREMHVESGGKVELTEADVVVSGGRGIKGPENFPMLQDLADALGGALGASRAVVDAGWIDHSFQVGQTGKTVSPGLYVAAGISGAIQHLAGMSSSKLIVAINKDPEAPIFKVADLGIVGDVFEIVPRLAAEVRKVRGS
jgi:electron transfer flavoprotein alpha subunit